MKKNKTQLLFSSEATEILLKIKALTKLLAYAKQKREQEIMLEIRKINKILEIAYPDLCVQSHGEQK